MDRNEFFLSICISSYNHMDNCLKLVNEILDLNENRISVIVRDDCSTDRTVEELRKINNNRLEVISNYTNCGPCKNWYNTINSGNGVYLLHVLDRDRIDVRQLKYLIHILEHRGDTVAGYIGESSTLKNPNNLIENSTYVYQRGKEALDAMGGIAIHPTGFFIKKSIWDSIQVRKYFYDDKKYGIYPHSYVMALAALKGNLLNINFKFYTYRYCGSTAKSRFYSRVKDPDYYWTPRNVCKVSTKMVLELCKYIDISYVDDFVFKRFQSGLYRATVSYKYTALDYKEMKHYGQQPKLVTSRELIWIAVKFFFNYINVINKVGIKKRKLLFNTFAELCRTSVSFIRDI